MVIHIDALNVAYMAVPKAACSSVKATLGALDPDNPISDPTAFSMDTLHDQFQTRRFRIHRWQGYDHCFRFTVVRDPLKRLLGVYTNRVVALRELFTARNFRRGLVDLPPDPDPDFFFQNLGAYIKGASTIKHHALPTSVFTGEDFGLYSKVYRTSDLADLAADLSEISGQDVTIPHVNSSGTPLRIDDLARKTRAAIAQRLAGEYAHLSAYFDNPFDQ
ncbi:sulfotransferase family 2 domain-containing protein [uncultured Tateyamaria sp.]|uniref:sulfotransferase family 2 domain-containing protein n=1 Tax=Tateyamaria sp. 1078 TaxID=3417464 RepID=UPI00263A35AB|nr:sulfotransferase family 2 domain-containing protein [uncultured Tateyamaria sp.]